MRFEYSQKVMDLRNSLTHFMDEHVYPAEPVHEAQISENPWSTPAITETLKLKARELGLWNLFLPPEHLPYGAGLSNLEYAPLAEIMGRSLIAPEIFNCSAPDTGNMEVLAKYGTEKQKQQWLDPLLAGNIRSAFAMTEPAVASSDATNIQTSIRREGGEYIITGRKFYISGAMNERCKIFIVMGKTDPDNQSRYLQQSQLLVPRETPGVEIVRPMKVFGNIDAPEGHAEIVFDNVRVPAKNLILGEGQGFEIAQGRLGPGRIHHCMRLIGQSQRALELMALRAENRVVFGQKMSKLQSVREDIARSACEIEQARLLTLKAADQMDRLGNRVAKDLIAMIKIIAPQMSCNVVDRAIQIHGAAGVGQDFPFAGFYQYARTIRLADGPDQVHMMQLGRNLAVRYAQELGTAIPDA